MKTSENRKFEEEWKDMMEGGEIAPSDHVWNSIDLKLSHAERGEMKKRVVFYQRLAAASVLFALCLGAAGWFWNYDGAGVKSLASQPVGENQSEAASTSTTTSKTSSDLENNDNSYVTATTESPSVNSAKSVKGNNEKGAQSQAENGGNNNAFTNENSGGNYIAAITTPANKSVLPMAKETGSENQPTSPNTSGFESRGVVQLATNELEVSTIQLTGKPIEQIEAARTFKIAKREEKQADDQDKNWWASLNGSGGAYNQNSSSNSVANSLFLQSPTPSLNKAPKSTESGVGTSFSYGMSLGKKISKRWMVMGGVNYLNQSIDYNSNIVLQEASQSRAFVADLASPSSSLASTAPYVLRNTNEFVSIPVQAGYLLLNRKAGVQLNAGVAADIFYRNTMTDLSGQFGSFSQEAGENSTYRSLNWTGLLGTELSYRMNKHYHVSLIPGFRYSFNSVLKSSTGSTINPLVWDVGFRLKYVF
ncbi:MAG: hypothetical protein ACK5RG_14330 [Cyclobacteriaceae bacterium]|jgi:hypothetical protein|nr:hypothetical protein [Flammeovirgaceae bacterium]